MCDGAGGVVCVILLLNYNKIPFQQKINLFSKLIRNDFFFHGGGVKVRTPSALPGDMMNQISLPSGSFHDGNIIGVAVWTSDGGLWVPRGMILSLLKAIRSCLTVMELIRA